MISQDSAMQALYDTVANSDYKLTCVYTTGCWSDTALLKAESRLFVLDPLLNIPAEAIGPAAEVLTKIKI
jgi:hypothetical protein